jgi:hypothetical protein
MVDVIYSQPVTSSVESARKSKLYRQREKASCIVSEKKQAVASARKSKL